MAETLNQNAVTALNAIADAFAPKQEKKQAEKSILVVNGKIQTQLLTDKEVREVALGLATSGAKIEQYSFVGKVEVDLPVYIPTAEEAELAEENEKTETKGE